MGHKLDFSNFSLFLRIRAKNSQFIEKRDFNFYSFRFSFGFATKPCECRRAGRLPPYPALHTSAFIKVFHGIARRAARVICLITMLTSSHTITSFSIRPGKRNKTFISYWMSFCNVTEFHLSHSHRWGSISNGRHSLIFSSTRRLRRENNTQDRDVNLSSFLSNFLRRHFQRC